MARRVSGITIPIKYMTNTKGLKQAESAFGKFGLAVAGIAAGAVAAVAGIGTAAVRMASEFEDNFAKIEGLVGVAKGDLAELEQAAARLGPQFGKSANEAAEALFFITSAGLRGSDAIEVLEASLQGAAVGLGDTKTIADLATSAVNAYGSSVLGGTEAVAVLTEAVREGKLEPAELAGAMGQVLPIASNLGVTFNEVGAAFAAMSRTGTDASQASTQLRGILNALVKPTAEAEQTLAGMGLSAAGLREQIKEQGLLATLETLTGAFDGNIEATASVFGNVRALTGVLDLMGAGVDTTREIFGRMTDDVSVLDDAFGAVEQTASFKFNRAMETARASLLPVGNLLLEIGARLLDRLMPVIERFAPMLEEMFSHLEEPLNDLIAAFPPLLDAMLPLLPLLGMIAGVIADLVVATMPIFTALFEALIPIFETLIPPLAFFITELVDRLAPILVTLIELFLPLVEALLPPFMQIFEALTPIIMTFIDAFLPIIEALLPLLVVTLETVVIPLLNMFAETLATVLPAAFDLFAQLGLSPNVDRMNEWANILSDIVYGVQFFMATGMNALISYLETATNQAIKMINDLLAAGRTLPGIAGDVFRATRSLSSVTFERVAMPELPEYRQRENALAQSFRDPGLASLNFAAFTPLDLGIDTVRPVDLSRSRFGIDALGIPQMAQGGIVSARAGGILANIGEGRYDEAVIPLKPGQDFGTTYNITVNAGIGTDGARVGEEIVRAIKQYERRSGPVFASV